jgi:hypothetical protein
MPIVKMYREVTVAMRVGKLTFTTTGNNTLPIAIPSPIITVPIYKVGVNPAERSVIPVVIRTKPNNRLGSRPIRWDILVTNGENKAKVNSGKAVKKPAADDVRLRPSIT